ncbi:MAG: tail fiber domain-containing protein [Akkermansiaceae bacterium]
MKTTTIIATFFAAGFLATAPAQQMNFQGRVTDNLGAPIPGPQTTLFFSIWDVATGGTDADNKVWGDFEINADLIDGRFSVKLGNLTGDDGNGRFLSSSFSGNRYIQIKVAGADPLPRQEVLASPTALNAVTLGNSQYKIEPGNRPTIGSASNSGYTFDGSNPGLLIETGYLESSGLFLNSNTAALYSPGNDGPLFSIYDADDLDAPGETDVAPQFAVLGSGGIEATGDSTIGGDLSVSGNITAGTITGTLTTPSLSLSNNLNVGGTDGGSPFSVGFGRIGINQRYSNVAANIRQSQTLDAVLRVENATGDPIANFKESGISFNRLVQMDELVVEGDTSVDGFTFLKGNTRVKGFTSLNGGGVVNRTGSFRAMTMTSTRSTVDTTYPMALKGVVPGYEFEYLYHIDSKDVGDADLVIDFGVNGAPKSIVAILEPGGGGWRAGSDQKLKENVQSIENCLAMVTKLKPKSYNYIADTKNQVRCGFIAQEVQEVMPSLVKQVDDTLTLNYGEFGVLAIGAVQELKSELDAEKAKNAALEARLKAIEESLGL